MLAGMGLFFGVVAAVMLYLHGLRSFSEEVVRLGGDRLRDVMRKVTATDLGGALAGAVSAALVQSSSAVNSIAMGLTHGGVLTLRGGWTLIIGANVGTTLTAWLVAYKVVGLGPAFLTVGGLWSLVGPKEWRTYGKPVFYFGLIFLALDQVGSALAPLARDPRVAQFQSFLETPFHALLFGVILTALVQSSSVVVGLTVLAVAEGLLGSDLAMWVVVGANIGTASTGLMSALAFGRSALRLALLNVGLDLLGLVIFACFVRPFVLPFLPPLGEPALHVALVHTVFNLGSALVALALMPRFWPRVEDYIACRDGRSGVC